MLCTMKRVRRCRERRGDKVMRAFDADAGIAQRGGRHLRLVEFARQVRQLVDDDVRPRLHHRALKRRGVEHVDDLGAHASRFEVARALRAYGSCR